MNIIDRCRGALIGLAVGDSLGSAVEFMPRGSFAPVTGYRGGGPHRLRADAALSGLLASLDQGRKQS